MRQNIHLLTAMVMIGVIATAVGCGQRSRSGESSSSNMIPITDREWSLVWLEGSAAGTGAGGRPVTLRLDSAGAKASGFGGCNRYGGSYSLAGTTLSFGPMISTKMFCAEGSELEQRYLSILPKVVSYEIQDSHLVLHGSAGPLTRFRSEK
jgi:heat shock protein HslJ